MRRLLAAALAVLVSSVFLLSFGASAAVAVTTANPLDVDDITHLDWDTPKNAASYKTTIPASLIKDLRVNAGTRPVADSNGPKLRTGAAGAHRQSKAAAALARKIPKGMTVSEYLGKLKTPQEAAAIASVRSKFTVPATGLARLGKLAIGGGPAGAMISAAGVGMGIGVEMSGAFGMNVEEGFCSPSYSDPLNLTAQVAGVDCTEFFQLRSDYLKNQDTGLSPNPDMIGSQSCVTATRCATVTRSFSNSTGTEMGYCLTLSGGTSLPNGNPVPQNRYASGHNAGLWANGLTYRNYAWNSDFINCPNTAGTMTGAFWIVASGATFSAWHAGGGAVTNPQTILAPKRADATRKLNCVIAATNGSSYSASSGNYTEGSGVIPSPKCPAVPQGVTAESVKISSTSPGGSDHELYMEPTTPGYRTWATEHPECGSGLCTADLRKLVGADTKSCFDELESSDCVGWFTDPNKTDLYRCTYGGKAVSLAECDHYADVFSLHNQAIGAPYTDPATNTNPGANTGPRIDNAMNNAVQDPEKQRVCFPTGWAVLNPIEWILKPVGCALEAAFVPRLSKTLQFKDKTATTWNRTVFYQVQLSLGTLFSMPVVGGGCQGPPMNINMAGWGIDETFYPFNACREPMAGVAATVRGIGGFLVVAGGLLAVVRYTANIVGYAGVGQHNGTNGGTSSVKFK